MNAAIYSLFRPLYRPIVGYLRRRLSGNYLEHPELAPPEPWDYIQLLAERRLHEYLGHDRNKVENIVIVGAYDGQEVARMEQTYPASRFFCFEPMPRNYETLIAHYGSNSRVFCRRLALSNVAGKETFFDPEMVGTGSLLQPDGSKWTNCHDRGLGNVQVVEVEVGTLDDELKELSTIDLLWLDVQGAELLVLQGGRGTLARTRAAFLEVWMKESAYENGCKFEEVKRFMEETGFQCIALGVDPANYVGNSLWIRADCPNELSPC